MKANSFKSGNTKEVRDQVIENNQVTLIGKVVGGFEFSHEVFGEGFYIMEVEVPRLSENYDVIPVMVSDRLIDVNADFQDQWLKIVGNFRSYNRHEEQKNRLILSVFAREIENVAEEDVPERSVNDIFIDGFLCKPSVYRKTPLGREIADILLAINRPYGKSDYIPCICWGRNARFSQDFKVGERINVWGRIQSRTYMKKISEDQVEERTAYEVSVSKIAIAAKETKKEDSEENGESEE